MPTVEAYRIEVDGKARAFTVAELRGLLANVPGGATVHLWSDAEGNEIRPMLEIHLGATRVELVPFD